MSCGDCTACCEVLPIIEINKPKNTMCSNCTGSGCAIYNNRPKACRTFECAYLVGSWNIALRPDKSGVIIANFNSGYEAIKISDKVTKRVKRQILSIEKNYGITIKRVNAMV